MLLRLEKYVWLSPVKGALPANPSATHSVSSPTISFETHTGTVLRKRYLLLVDQSLETGSEAPSTEAVMIENGTATSPSLYYNKHRTVPTNSIQPATRSKSLILDTVPLASLAGGPECLSCGIYGTLKPVKSKTD